MKIFVLSPKGSALPAPTFFHFYFWKFSDKFIKNLETFVEFLRNLSKLWEKFEKKWS